MVYEIIIKPCPISYYCIPFKRIAGTYQLVINENSAVVYYQRKILHRIATVDFDDNGDLAMVCIGGFFVRWQWRSENPESSATIGKKDLEHIREECVEVWREYEGYRRRVV